MLDSPDFEPEFYDRQIALMCGRYAVLFARWGLKWDRYLADVTLKLRGHKYWLWVYLCGFEKFVQESAGHRVTRARLEKDCDARVARIIGDYYKVVEYVRHI